MMALASLLGEVTTPFLDFLSHFLVQFQNECDESTAFTLTSSYSSRQAHESNDT